MKLPVEQMDEIRDRLASGDLCARTHHLKAFGESVRKGMDSLLGLAPDRQSRDIESGDATDAELLDGVDGNVIALPMVERRSEPKSGPNKGQVKIERVQMIRTSPEYPAFKAANPGKILLTPTEWQKVMLRVASIREHDRAMELLSGDRKVPIKWEREKGIWCQATPDSLGPAGEADLKRTAWRYMASGEAFSRHMRDLGWDLQRAMYYEAANSIGQYPNQYFVAVEAEPSLANSRHEVRTFRFAEQCHDEAHQDLERLWGIFRRWLESGDVPDVGDIDTVPKWRDQ